MSELKKQHCFIVSRKKYFRVSIGARPVSIAVIQNLSLGRVFSVYLPPITATFCWHVFNNSFILHWRFKAKTLLSSQLFNTTERSEINSVISHKILNLEI